MVQAEDVISIYQRLLTNGIQVWVTGGWGIDALLGEQTRPHKDLDVFMLLDDVQHMCMLLATNGYTLKDLWEENCWAVDAHGARTATAFVLQDSEGRELDVHAMRLDEAGNGIPAWQETEEFIITAQDRSGQGRIAGFSVKCITPEMQVVCHTGYEIPEKQLLDLEFLHKKFSTGYQYRRSTTCTNTSINTSLIK